MYRRSLSVLFVCMSTVLAQSDEYSPYFDPVQYARSQPLILHKRQNCPTNYDNCGALGAGAEGACCPIDQNCAVDDVGHVACCPIGAFCTGTIDGTITVPVTTTTTSTPTNGASTTSFNAAVTSGVAGGGATVPNSYYPFVYMPTAYANGALCSSADTSCQAESTACFESLAGVFGVTVSGVAGGTTATGNSAVAVLSASSVCSSLSQEGCRGLQTEQCAGTGNAAGPRPTPCRGMMYAMGAGAAVGAAGALIQ